MKDISESDETLSSNFSEFFEGPPAPDIPSNRNTESALDPSVSPSNPPPTAAASVNAFEMDVHTALPPMPPEVWWDKDDLKPPANDTSSQYLQQPSLETERNQQHDRSPSKSLRLSLEDVLKAQGSYEQQVETHIHKALEDEYPEHYNPERSNNTATTSSILSQVPESASHDFAISPELTEGEGINATLGSPERDYTEEGDVENESPQPTSMRSAMRSRRSSKHQQMKPLIQAARASMATRLRKLTVERTLSEVTSAMSDLHDERPSTRFNDRHLDGDDSSDSDDSEENNYAYKNATALSRVQGARAPTMNKAKDRWGHLRRNLPAAPVEIEAEVAPTTNKAKDRWGHLRRNLSAAAVNEQGKIDPPPVDEEAKTKPPSIIGNERLDHLLRNPPSLREGLSHEPTLDDCETTKHHGNTERETEVGYGVPEDSGEASEEDSVGNEGGRKQSRGPQNNFRQGISSNRKRQVESNRGSSGFGRMLSRRGRRNRGSSRFGRMLSRRGQSSRRGGVISDANDKLKGNWEDCKAFFLPRKDRISIYIKTVLFYLMLPAGVLAAILFFFCGNPLTETGKGTSETDSQDGASVSWWLIFMCVRQVVTFSLALGLQGFIIDFLSLGTRLILRLAGPVITLLVVSSKGWPFIVFSWAVINFATLHGDGVFAKHWFFWQDAIDMFNSNNPSGNIVNNEWYTRALLTGIFVSLVVAIKRFVVGLYLGKQTFCKFVPTD
jgi:hypothetical protein